MSGTAATNDNGKDTNSHHGSFLSGHISCNGAENRSSDAGINSFIHHTSPSASTANYIPPS